MHSALPAINTAVDLDPISPSNERVASLLCQDQHLLPKCGIMGIGGGKGKCAVIRSCKKGLFPCAEVREVQPERAISQERAFFFFLCGAEDLQRFVDT